MGRSLIDLRLLLPYILFFFPATVFVEFIVYYITLAKERAKEEFNEKNLLKQITLIHLLTFPLSLILGISFAILFLPHLFIIILLIEMMVISLESLLLPEMIFKETNSQLSNFKFIGAVCIANIVSMLVGFFPYTLFFPSL